MHLKGLDLNLLIVLDTLLAEKNVTRTGQRINLSQPGVSRALAQLREFFGDPLLTQVGQRMELTTLAETLVTPVREVISRCESIIAKNQAFTPESSTRTFRLNMSDYEAAVIMNQAVRRISEIAPQVRIEISSITTEPARDFLERGYLDFLVTPADMTSTLHPSVRLFDDQFVAVVCAENPLASSQLTLEAYLGGDHIATNFGKTLGWTPDEVFLARAGHHRNIRVVAPTFSALMTQVSGTQLIATTYERFARFYAQILPIRILPIPLRIPPQEFRVQWHRLQDNDYGIRWLRDILCGLAAELDPLTKAAPEGQER